MDWWHALLAWFAANKDALVAIAALLSPLIAVTGTVIASIVSYRAVVTGPRLQREISREQFGLTSRQLDLQERTAVANLLGAADQKWIEDFREVLAELHGLITEAGSIQRAQKVLQDPAYKDERENELLGLIPRLVAKISLMVGPPGELLQLINDWFSTAGNEGGESGSKAFACASWIIAQKQAGIAARITAIERSTQSQS